MLHSRVVAAVAAIAALGVGAAGCSVPAGRSETALQDIRLAPDGPSIDARVPKNATLETLLQRHELSAETTGSLLRALTGVFNPRQLRANQAYRISTTIDGLLREFRYQIDADRLLRVIRRPSMDAAPAFSAEVVTLPKTVELDALVGEIGRGDSLIGVLDAAGENEQLALAMAAIFGGEVDFNSDLQPGDKFELLFERATRDGEFAGYGDIKAAVLVNGGRRLTAVWTEDSDGKPVWYDVDGRSLKRQFRKSPLGFDPRITSGFSMNRFHPVHGTYRAHLGVDYGAPAGTRVFASASGVVDFAGWNGEAGRMVRIRHAGGYQTAYLHLSSIPAGIRPGARVSQDDLIGYVGSTGTATGPHLDFRILKNGKYVNPTAELKRMPKGEPLAADRLPAFLKVRDDAMSQLAAKIAVLGRRPGL
ncbi:MAG TPA: M23 family metallopeptidase [Vicinamibacterales bacterium]|nr:M23 family metallopeptidase [Vicinamibacterales bacterium]